MASDVQVMRDVAAGRARIARVKRVDWFAARFITLAGFSIIVAVLFIFVFIFKEALPLFQPASGSFSGALRMESAGSSADAKPLAFGIDEYQLYLYEVLPASRIAFFQAKDGKLAREFAIAALQDTTLVAASRSLVGDFVGLGTADGRLSLQQVTFQPQYVDQKLSDLELGVQDRGTFLVDPQKRPVREVAYQETDGRRIAAAVVGDDSIVVIRVDDGGTEQRDELKTRDGERVTRVRIGRSDTLSVATEKGNLYYWELAPEVRLVEVTSVSSVPITALEYALGSVSLLVGDAKGNLSTWFRVRLRDDDPEPTLVHAHSYPPQTAAIRAIGPSRRDKSFVTTGEDGSLQLRHMTSERTLLDFPATGQALESVLITPKNDGILTRQADGKLGRYEIASPHPEISWKALFGKVWYEGYPGPEYVWQSTGGTDDFEPKFSLVPLVFGTIKGTAYALLFAIPLAVMGALYTSQFMHPQVKAKVKPTVEIMAALPSVVVGFIAGLWLASRLERELVPALLMILVLPAFGTSGLLLWQCLPRRLALRIRPGMELLVILPLLVFGAWCALQAGPWLEATLFQGDLRLWLQSSLDIVYDQRNCLVVGLAMGFAVIPIIFTISEDALSSVPSHLTAGSLALGASRWQTALRVILPTASPGIFSAIMIGFGRAVGETMIVLMATGNTPVLDWSIFNGMRTLSANIAVEIPEAPYGGTLYRTLFLAAALLFFITFVANTIAEVVRQRLRERYRTL